MQLLELLFYFPVDLKVHLDLPPCLYPDSGPTMQLWWGLELKQGHLRGSKACVAFREVFDAHQWHSLGRDGGT